MNFYEELINTLKTNEEYVSEDHTLLKNKIIEDAMKLDDKLVSLLFNNKMIRERLFRKINKAYIFDKVEFGWLINNKEFLPDSFTKFKNKIGLSNNKGEMLKENADIVLSFPFKDCLLEFDSTDENENRNEIFYNELISKDRISKILSPKVFTNIKKITKDGEKAYDKFDICDNLFIKGNNLISLSSLLPRYRNQIKCMYWDILYNTNNDIVPYNDSFKHSSWLTMMKNRLEVAKELLDKKSGVIIIECDKNEDAYLKVLMDEIFGRDNFINSITLQSSTPSGTKLSHRDSTILKTKDTLLIYKTCDKLSIVPQYTTTDNLTNFNYYLDVDSDGNYIIKNLADVLIENGIISKKKEMKNLKLSNNVLFEKFVIEHQNNIFRKQPSMPDEMKRKSQEQPEKILKYNDNEGNEFLCQNGYRFAFISSAIRNVDGEDKVTQLLCDIWTDISFHGTQYEGPVELPNGKKPERLIKRILDMFTDEGDIVLDAYFGSGTTGAVALKMNRRFIGLEQLDSHCEKTMERLKSVIDGDATGISSEVNWNGGGSFVYCELKDLNNNYINRISNSNTTSQLSEIYKELLESGFISYRVDTQLFNSSQKEFESLTIDEQKKIIIAMIDKNQLYVNYCDIDDEDYNVSDLDKKYNKSFYKGE